MKWVNVNPDRDEVDEVTVHTAKMRLYGVGYTVTEEVEGGESYLTMGRGYSDMVRVKLEDGVFASIDGDQRLDLHSLDRNQLYGMVSRVVRTRPLGYYKPRGWYVSPDGVSGLESSPYSEKAKPMTKESKDKKVGVRVGVWNGLRG